MRVRKLHGLVDSYLRSVEARPPAQTVQSQHRPKPTAAATEVR